MPARNTIFISLAAAYGETIKANSIFIGANAIDYSGYPDCRPGFFNAMEKTLNLGTELGESSPPEISTTALSLTMAHNYSTVL